VKIKWLGHASFLITADNGVKIITDPYTAGNGLNYGQIAESADVVLISHEHGDHSNTAAVKGSPTVLRGAGSKEVKGLKFKGIATFHDENMGKQRGANTIFAFDVDGVKVCHLGDLGHVLSEKEAVEIGRVDVLCVPVGGFYTIDAGVATSVVNKISPRVAIPMHFKTSKVDTAKFGGIVGVEEFLKGKAEVTRLNGTESEFKAGKLTAATQILVFKSAL